MATSYSVALRRYVLSNRFPSITKRGPQSHYDSHSAILTKKRVRLGSRCVLRKRILRVQVDGKHRFIHAPSICVMCCGESRCRYLQPNFMQVTYICNPKTEGMKKKDAHKLTTVREPQELVYHFEIKTTAACIDEGCM